MSKPGVDWAAIEPLYSAGERSLKDLAREFGVSDKGIAKHAEKHGWTRESSVRAIVREPKQPRTGAREPMSAGRAEVPASALTVQQEAFCQAYMLNGGDASAAYRSAYAAGKMKPESVNRTAFQLLQNLKVASRIAAMRKAAAEVAVLEEARVLREVGRIALSDPGELFNDEGDLLNIKQLPPALRACIASVEIDNRTERDPDDPKKLRSYTVKKVKLWDKNSALEKAMKHLGSFEKDNRQRAGLFDDLPPNEAQAVRDFLSDLSRAASARVKSAAGAD